MVLWPLPLGILASIVINWHACEHSLLRRITHIAAWVGVIGMAAAMTILVYGPPHVDRSGSLIEGLRLLSIGCIGYLANATGMYTAALRLVGLVPDKELDEPEVAGRDDDAQGEDPDEPEDHENRKT
jgi:hypothetical protein